MNIVTLPEATENILLYLLVAPRRCARTRETLHTISDDQGIDEALTWLTENGYVYQDQGGFELTLAGLHSARQIQDHAQPLSANPAPAHRESARDSALLPIVDAHPLRTRTPSTHHALALDHQILHYMLAFDLPKNVLPVPVLNGDIVGRLSDADISLRHDDYISGHHCRFTITNENGQPELYVEDLGSRNGTFIDDFRLEKDHRFQLEHGNRLQIGNTILIVMKIPN